MRPVKIFGLASVAAAVAMAFVGASPAMATNSALCTEDNALVCPLGKVYTGHIEGLAEDPVLLGTFFGVKGNILCEHSLILGNALGLGNPQLTHIESITFTGNCKTSLKASCIVTATALGLVNLLKTLPNLGIATSVNSAVNISCGGFPSINCEIGGSPEMHAVGSPTAHLLASDAILTIIKGSGCPSSPKLDALYKIKLPLPIYIAE